MIRRLLSTAENGIFAIGMAYATILVWVTVIVLVGTNVVKELFRTPWIEVKRR